ncbi:MAG: HAMP domain-containing histidine kinase [Ignavibacteriae bacterium]|nr:HAMP domain-containing histidine kinase [Ignavibacteriota bacterium]
MFLFGGGITSPELFSSRFFGTESVPETEPLYRPFEPPDPSRTFSLFWKVLTLIVCTGVVATLSLGAYYRFILKKSYSGVIAEQLQGYVELVATEIGYPPDLSAIEAITEKYPLDLRVETSDSSWASDSTIPSHQELLRRASPEGFDAPPSFIFRELDDQYYGVLDRGSDRLVIRFRGSHGHFPILPATLILGGGLFLLFLGAWYGVRRLLHPVNELMEGVKAVGSGNFKYRVPVRSTDELGTLVSAFNAMSEQIGEIIASKRRLLFDVSHELRSPLTRMNIAIAMLPESKTRNTLQRNANELNTMITELLENERLAVQGAALVVERIDLVALAYRVIESFTDEQERIEFDTLTDSLDIVADVQRLTVALRNVVSNALKYSDVEDPPVKVKVFPDDDGVRIIVKDHGIGIPEEAIEKIFEPFYRTDESRTRTTGGYGLGLALTKAIIEAHGGTINAESREGDGTTVTVWLPSEPVEKVMMPEKRAKKKAPAVR